MPSTRSPRIRFSMLGRRRVIITIIIINNIIIIMILMGPPPLLLCGMASGGTGCGGQDTARRGRRHRHRRTWNRHRSDRSRRPFGGAGIQCLTIPIVVAIRCGLVLRLHRIPDHQSRLPVHLRAPRPWGAPGPRRRPPRPWTGRPGRRRCTLACAANMTRARHRRTAVTMRHGTHRLRFSAAMPSRRSRRWAGTSLLPSTRSTLRGHLRTSSACLAISASTRPRSSTAPSRTPLWT
jgi:hypothetical protein